MGQMYGILIALAVAASASGCTSVTNKLDESGPSSGKVTKRESKINRDVSVGDNCELKRPGGGGQCEDGRHTLAKSKTAAKKIRP